MLKEITVQTIVTIVAGGIIAALGVFYDWSHGWALVKWVWDGLVATSPISRWFFWFLVLAAAVPNSILVMATIHAQVAPHEAAFVSFYRYGMYWKWTWYNGRPWAATALCPNCLRTMRYSHDRHGYEMATTYSCQNCSHVHFTLEGDPEETDKKVRIEIEHAIRTNTWQSETPAPAGKIT